MLPVLVMQPHAIRVRKPLGAQRKHFVSLETGRHMHGSAAARPFYKLEDSVLHAYQMFQSQVNQRGVKIVSHIKILPGFNSLQAFVQKYNNECNITTLLSYKITVCMPSEGGFKRGRGKQLLHFQTTTMRSGSSMVFGSIALEQLIKSRILSVHLPGSICTSHKYQWKFFQLSIHMAFCFCALV